MPSNKKAYQSTWSSSAKLLLPLSTVLLVSMAGGCSPAVVKYPNAAAAGFQGYDAPQLVSPLSAAVQSEGISLTKQFVGRLKQRNYEGAETMMLPSLKSTWPASSLRKDVETGGYGTLVRSKDWIYDQVQPLRHGKQMVVHAHFNTADGNLYHVNFVYDDTGSAWEISMVMDPVLKTKPTLAVISVMKGGPSTHH